MRVLVSKMFLLVWPNWNSLLSGFSRKFIFSFVILLFNSVLQLVSNLFGLQTYIYSVERNATSARGWILSTWENRIFFLSALLLNWKEKECLANLRLSLYWSVKTHTLASRNYCRLWYLFLWIRLGLMCYDLCLFLDTKTHLVSCALNIQTQ